MQLALDYRYYRQAARLQLAARGASACWSTIRETL